MPPRKKRVDPASAGLPVVRLHALGLGLMIYSPAAVRALEEGEDYMPPRGPLREPLLSLVEREQRVVLLSVGSPQVDYAIHPRLGRAPSSVRRAAAAKVTFGLQIEGGALCIRDGYDPMQWIRHVPRRQTISMADGRYTVHALWIDSESEEAMTIVLCFERRGRRVPGNGWPYLDYSISGRRDGQRV